MIAVSDIMTGPPNTQDFHTLYIVTKLYECDLERIVSSGQTLTDQHYQYFVYQILRGLKYIHSANVLHRDLKPGNLLVNSNCDLCICDFGLARGVSAEVRATSNLPHCKPQRAIFLQTEGNLTEYVVTRWYRAPELLCESETYGAGVDVWSAGCIFGELLARRPLFKGKSTSKQLELIVSTLGTPTADEMKKITSPGALQVIQALPPRKKITLADWKKIFPHADESALDLLHSMLQFDPDKRVSLVDALNHPYLKELHAKAREPVCDTVFDFEYEKDYPDEMPQALLQKYMFEEMNRLQEANAAAEASAKAGADSESKK